MGLLRKGPETGVICESPRIEVHDGFATAQECAHVIKLARDNMGSASIINSAGESVDNQLRRTANVAWVRTDATPIVKGLVARAADVAGLAARTCETIQVVHYEVGGKYTPHLDTFGTDTEHFRRDGQRLKTGLLYLHEPNKGGATSFPKVKAKVKPKIGRLALFDLVVPGTNEPDLNAVHAGTPVWSGEKWACNFWFRERPVKAARRHKATKSPKRKRRK